MSTFDTFSSFGNTTETKPPAENSSTNNKNNKKEESAFTEKACRTTSDVRHDSLNKTCKNTSLDTLHYTKKKYLDGKRLMIYARVDYQTYSMLEELSEKLGSSLSEAIRQSIIVMHGLLSNVPDIAVGRVVIQNPAVNINYVKQEAVQVSKSDNVLKLKREIDKLQRELEKTLSENIELKSTVEKYKQYVSDVCRLITELGKLQVLPLTVKVLVEKLKRECAGALK